MLRQRGVTQKEILETHKIPAFTHRYILSTSRHSRRSCHHNQQLYLLKLQHFCFAAPCPSLSKCAVGDQSCRRSSFGNSLFCSFSKNDSNSLSVWMYLTSLSLSFSLPPHLWCFKNSFVSLLPDINRLRAQMFSDTNTNRAWTRIHARLSKLLNKQAQRRNQSISTDRVTSSRAHNAVKIGKKTLLFDICLYIHRLRDA